MQRAVTWGVGILLALLASTLAVLYWPRTPGPAPTLPFEAPRIDPRTSYAGPYQNVRPEIQPVGDAKCAECHPDLFRQFRGHPMGQSAGLVTGTDNQTFDALGLHFWVRSDGNQVWHGYGQGESERKFAATHWIGSGTRGKSFLAEIGGQFVQTPVSWFSQTKAWDLSPGYAMRHLSGRIVDRGCLFCHTNDLRPGSQTGHLISCERCHGPGERHVQRHEQGLWELGESDFTIVNPAHLSWQLRDNVCEQCHLGGELRLPRRGRDWYDYRPGMPLESVLAIHVVNPALPGSHRAVGHVEQMTRSMCFTASTNNRKLGCISCHDPHCKPTPAERVGHFRQRCLNCHQDRGCSVHLAERWRQVPGDSCIACHMPRQQTADIAHTALTDHRIIRPGKTEAGPLVGLRGADDTPVVLFHGDRLDSRDPEVRRDSAVAMTFLGVARRLPEWFGRPALVRSVGALETALARSPADPEGWLALGLALNDLDRHKEALKALTEAARQNPASDEAQSRLAGLAEARGDQATALAHLRRTVEIQPLSVGYRERLARALLRQGERREASEHASAWVRLEPHNAEAQRLLAECQGKGK